MQEQVYIISDVHGCIKSLKALVSKLPKNSKLIFVGDLIDRGKNSKEVIEFVKSNNYDCIRGNHEEYMIHTMKVLLNNPDKYEESQWIKRLGGKATLDSYGNIDGLPNNKIFLEHLQWLESLPFYLEYKDLKTINNRSLVITHAPVNDTWKYRDCPQDTDEFKLFYNEAMKSRRFGKYDNEEIFNVFGHTPLPEPKISDSFAAIDLGCVFDDGINLKGYLCALEFPSMNVIKQENIED